MAHGCGLIALREGSETELGYFLQKKHNKLFQRPPLACKVRPYETCTCCNPHKYHCAFYLDICLRMVCVVQPKKRWISNPELFFLLLFPFRREFPEIIPPGHVEDAGDGAGPADTTAVLGPDTAAKVLLEVGCGVGNTVRAVFSSLFKC